MMAEASVHSDRDGSSRSTSPFPDPDQEPPSSSNKILTNGPVPLQVLCHKPAELVKQALKILPDSQLRSIMAPSLQGKSRDELLGILIDEAEGMSRKRLMAAVKGEKMLASSSSSDSVSECELLDEKEPSRSNTAQDFDRVSLSVDRSHEGSVTPEFIP